MKSASFLLEVYGIEADSYGINAGMSVVLERVGKVNIHLLAALAIGFVFHGGLLIAGSFKGTYDAFVHIFFADHYARFWFDHWESRWYTGFTMTSYPPGSQQAVALLSFIMPGLALVNAFIVVQLIGILLTILGMYRFAKIWVSEEAAGYAALIAVFASSIGETVHLFGQLPTIVAIGLLLNAMPYAYEWMRDGKTSMLFLAWSVNAATTAAHHVTTLFGAVFFIGPVIVLALVEKLMQPLPDEEETSALELNRQTIRPLLASRFRRILPTTLRAGIYGVGLILILIIVVLPYWIWSTSDPITQVPIPHASRDSFIENIPAGIIFFVVPWGVSIVGLPYVFYKGLSTKSWPLTLSIALLFVLGTGGTTPIPRFLLRGAFDILTLDRFTFWAAVGCIPLLGEFVVSLRHGQLAQYLREQFGQFVWIGTQFTLVFAFLAMATLTVNLTKFRLFQPPPLDMAPIVNFMNKDQHWRWRYLTLGLGDQLAWLSTQMTAGTVDGNYHSARRLPELTTTPVERLEGAKFRGIPGIGSLQQFLAVPDKYNLKYIFSNDQFYDPLLFFSGWHRVQQLENGVMVWEREDIPPLPEVLPRREIPIWQRAMWGILPMASMFLALVMTSAFAWWPLLFGEWRPQVKKWRMVRYPQAFGEVYWEKLDERLVDWSKMPAEFAQYPPQSFTWWVTLSSIKLPKPAPPSARMVRSLLLITILLAMIGTVAQYYFNRTQDPTRIVEAYYDDIDFRRFDAAYDRLDPDTRPAMDQFLLELSVTGGLVVSYAKLDTITTELIAQEPDRVEILAHTTYVTSLEEYKTTQHHILNRQGNQWFMMPTVQDFTIPPDQFVRQRDIAWLSQGRRRVTTETTSFADVLDRPELQILSANMVKVGERYHIVGELINTDVDPADVTVTALVYNEDGELVTTYNAQQAIIHKIFPKEVTPFRIDFEGVAGLAFTDMDTAGYFEPDAFSPITMTADIDAFDVYAKAVVTGRDLHRDVTVQQLRVETRVDGQVYIVGELLNAGTLEATIPHILLTFYDENDEVVWVDDYYAEMAIRPQRSIPFEMPITPSDQVQQLNAEASLYANILQNEVRTDDAWRERLPFPEDSGYHSVRVSVHYFVGGGP